MSCYDDCETVDVVRRESSSLEAELHLQHHTRDSAAGMEEVALSNRFDSRLIVKRTNVSTNCDFVFRFLCVIVGVKSDGKRSPRLARLVLVVWLLIHAIGISSFAMRVKDWLRTPRSLSFLAFFPRVAVLVCAEVSSLIRFFARHDEIQAMLQGNGRRFQDFWAHVTCPVISILKYCRLFALNDGLLVYFVLLEIFMASFFVIYTDVIIQLQKIQANILVRAQNIGTNRAELLSRKWDLRRRVSRVNRCFAWILALSHVRIFKAAFRAVSNLIHQRNWIDVILILIEQLIAIIQLSEFARRSSNLKRSCLEIEQSFSNQAYEGAINTETLREMRLVMRFHEDLDSLRNGCYPLEIGKFLHFLMTSMACVVVMLQFDYEVARSLTSL